MSSRYLNDAARSLIKVTKFGGSSCGNAECYTRLGDYFANELHQGHRPVGVFSAMFAVTDKLLNALAAAEQGDAAAVAAARKSVWDLHVRTLDGLVGNVQVHIPDGRQRGQGDDDRDGCVG